MIEIGIGFEGPDGLRTWHDLHRGRYIAIEGDEGSGKTTQAAMLVEWLREQGIVAEEVREPGGDLFGEALRRIIKSPEYEHEADEELLVFTAARLGMRRRVVLPLLEKGTWVVTDRSELSTYVYQGLAGGLSLGMIADAMDIVRDVCVPDYFFILDVSLETSRRRLAARDEAADVFELRGDEYRRQVNDGYRQLVQLDGLPYSICMVNAEQSVRGVQSEIRRTFRDDI